MTQDQTPPEQPLEPAAEQPAACPACSSSNNLIKILIIIGCLTAAAIITYRYYQTQPTYPPLPTQAPNKAAAVEQAKPAAETAVTEAAK